MRHFSDALVLVTMVLHSEDVAIVVAARGVQQLAHARHSEHGGLLVSIRARSLAEVVQLTFHISKFKY